VTENSRRLSRWRDAISRSGFSIYRSVRTEAPHLWIPTDDLEALLSDGLLGMDVGGLPLRTRSRLVKQAVCTALGYSIPKVFKRTQPRFPGQQLDTYVQKSNNLQIWNEAVAPQRRYAVFHVSSDDVIDAVKVVTGDVIAQLDKTGTLTSKYQARIVPGEQSAELITPRDTDNLAPLLASQDHPHSFSDSPLDHPTPQSLLPIAVVFERLLPLLQSVLNSVGSDQERNRAAQLQLLVTRRLGYSSYRDDGQFPDLPHQLLEIKLQTSPTIDLGGMLPDSHDPLGVLRVNNTQIRHCDVRYALFYGRTTTDTLTLSHFFLTTGEAFFTRFPQFAGRVTNRKLQIPLPADFFDR
jgi:hypothetical protein